MRYVDVGDGPPVLLIHGLGASWHAWSGNLEALSSAHRTIVVDLPGFGGSDGLGVHAELEDYAGCLVALLDALGIARCAVIGHSLGGLISQTVAAHYPERVTSLVLVASGGGPLDQVTEMAFKLIALVSRPLRLAPRPLVNTALRVMMAVPAARHRLLSRAVYEPNEISRELAMSLTDHGSLGLGIAGAMRAGLRTDSDAYLGALRCPVLVIGGAEDPIVTPAQTAYVAARVKQATCQSWPAVGHHPMWERPRQFDRVVLEFLRSPATPTEQPA
jgi:pimeloyl-ACP methyl ester carboxylesterase